MVALLENSLSTSKTALRARGATSSFTSRRATALKSRNRTELGVFTYDARDRLGSCSKEGNLARGRSLALFTGYIPYSYSEPVLTIDPSGNVRVVLEPVAQDLTPFHPCKTGGRYSWGLGLDVPSPEAGWIIQRVCIECGYQKCPCDVRQLNTDPSMYDLSDFSDSESGHNCAFEAWKVNQGDQHKIGVDTFQHVPPTKGCGFRQASASFYFVTEAQLINVARKLKIRGDSFFPYKNEKYREVKFGKCSTARMGPYVYAYAPQATLDLIVEAAGGIDQGTRHGSKQTWACCDCENPDGEYNPYPILNGGTDAS